MTPDLRDLCRRFAASTRGIAAVEFGMIVPTLLLLFLGAADAGRAVSIYMKVHSATYTLGAMANQYSTIQSADMTQIVGATSTVLSPYPSSSAVVTISQLAVTAKGIATVSWSYSLNGTARTTGAVVTIPSALATAITDSNTTSGYLLLNEVSYPYTPLFGYFVTGKLTLYDSIYVTPRSVSCIVYLASC
jgi:Flp pilus assembly protein TadG